MSETSLCSSNGAAPEELPSREQAAASWGLLGDPPALAAAGSLFTCKCGTFRFVRASLRDSGLRVLGAVTRRTVF